MIRQLCLCICLMVTAVTYGTPLAQNTSFLDTNSAAYFWERQPKKPVNERIVIHSKLQDGSDQTIARKAIFTHYKGAKATVLISHGFMCNKFDVGFLRQIFPPGKYNVMTFDFRAHGEDTAGQCCTFGKNEAHDVIAAARFIKNHKASKDKPLFAYGFSMGAAASIEAQAKDPSLFTAMILDCPFDSSENVIKRGLDNMKFSLFGYRFAVPGKSVLHRYAFHPYVQSFVKAVLKTVANMDARNIQTRIEPVYPYKSIEKISIPCFFIHCKNDEKVPTEAVRRVYDGASGYKVLWLTKGRAHFDSFFYNPEQYAARIQNFIEMVIHKIIEKDPVREHVLEDVDDIEQATHYVIKNKEMYNEAI